MPSIQKSRLKSKLVVATALVAALAAFASNLDTIADFACEHTPLECGPPQLSVRPADARLLVGNHLQLVIDTTNGKGLAVVYASADSSVAVVDPAGKVTGIAAGIALVTVSLQQRPSVKAFSQITVYAAPAPPTSQPESSSSRIAWQVAYHAADELRTLGEMHGGGVSATNREKLLDILRSLDLSMHRRLSAERDSLVGLVQQADTVPNQPYWNMNYSPELSRRVGALRRDVEIEALRHGVARIPR